MKKKSLQQLVLLIIVSLGYPLHGQDIQYPQTEQQKVIDEYHGHQILDPYRWLEDTESTATRNWMSNQDQFLGSFLSDQAQNQMIQDRIAALDKTGTNYGVPQQAGEYYFFNTWPRKLRHAFLHRQKGLNGKASIIVDFNKLLQEEDLSFNGFSVSPNGKYLAFQVNKGQSRWAELWLFDIQKKVLLSEKIFGLSSATVAWQANDEGFYYVRYGATEELAKNELNTSIHYHQMGSPSSNDQKIFYIPDNPNTLFRISMDSDRSHVVVQVYQGRSDRNTIHLLPATNPKSGIPLIKEATAAFNYIGSDGPAYYFYTNQDAPNGKVIQLDSRNLALHKTIIEEDDKVLAGGSTAGGNAMNFIDGRFVLLYREGTQQEIRTYTKTGKLLHHNELETGWIGSGLQGIATGQEAWYSLNTFLDPSTVYRIDLKTGNTKDFFERKLPIDKSEYITRNTYYESSDGTKVPIYIVHKKGLRIGEGNPVYMYAYGFGGWVAVPWYQPHLLTWLDMGGIYVLPGVRGGGEFGEAWKEAGIRMNRQNAIDDYIAAAEFLVEEGYTQPGRVVANGWSASGSLAAAAVQQRPALFGAAMVGIPSLDLLRYTEFTPFKGWTRGYGSPAIEEEFKVLYKWSPYHNIKSNTLYPPMMITVGEKDMTTPPQHGYKFVAAMQAHQQSSMAPTLLKIVWGGGHGFGVTNEQRRETYSQELQFLAKVLELEINPSWN